MLRCRDSVDEACGSVGFGGGGAALARQPDSAVSGTCVAAFEKSTDSNLRPQGLGGSEGKIALARDVAVNFAVTTSRRPCLAGGNTLSCIRCWAATGSHHARTRRHTRGLNTTCRRFCPENNISSANQVLGGGEGNIALMRDLAEENDKLAAENARLTSKCVTSPQTHLPPQSCVGTDTQQLHH